MSITTVFKVNLFESFRSFIGKTPLQFAKIPVMNSIARTGICGIHDPV